MLGTTRAGEAPRPAHGVDNERVVGTRMITRLLRRPEVGAALGALAVFLLFALDPTSQSLWLSQAGLVGWLSQAWQFGIMAVPVGLLMIAGEFDLSTGVMTGATDILMALLANELHWNLWACMGAALVFAILVGLINGLLVIKTRLHSFIV